MIMAREYYSLISFDFEIDCTRWIERAVGVSILFSYRFAELMTIKKNVLHIIFILTLTKIWICAFDRYLLKDKIRRKQVYSRLSTILPRQSKSGFQGKGGVRGNISVLGKATWSATDGVYLYFFLLYVCPPSASVNSILPSMIFTNTTKLNLLSWEVIAIYTHTHSLSHNFTSGVEKGGSEM